MASGIKASIQLFCAVALLVAAGQPRARAADPTTGQCLAATEAGLAARKDGRLRDARAQYLICAAATCPADVRQECFRRFGEIDAAIPTIVFEAKDAAGNDVGNVRVTMDGRPFAPRLEGRALAIDPGRHEFTFEAPGKIAVRKEFVIGESEKNRRERVIFGPPAVVAQSGPAKEPIVSPLQPVPATPAAKGGWSTRRTLALVTAGVGVVGVGIGIGFGIAAITKHNAASSECPQDLCQTHEGVVLWDSATFRGDVSTIAFIAGGAALAGAAALWFTASPRSAEAHGGPHTEVGLGVGSVLVRGFW
jgi:hypothetical protein